MNMKKLARFAVLMVCGCGLALGQQAAPAAGQGAPAPAKVWPAPAAAKQVANPAIWRVKGAHGTVYLFGSIHVMKPNVDWETAKVKTALESSDVLYLEVADLDDEAAVAPLAMQFGIDSAHPLSTKISKDDVALLDAAAKSAGMPGEAMFEPMRPWLVSMTLSVLPLMKAGYQPTSGIDMVLLAQSKKEQRPVKGFETMTDQIHMVADVPEDEQVKMLHKDLVELDKATADTNEMVAAWERGDGEKIAKINNEDLATKYPDEYTRLVIDRNGRWVATLEGMLKDPAAGTAFVAVGAAHLAGPDSVIKMLQKDGFKVERE